MFQESPSGATAPTARAVVPSSGRLPDPSPRYDTIRHMLFGSPAAVQATIKLLYKLNYAEPNDWSKLMPTGQPNEVVSVLTRKVKV
ncbi:MAG: hypothetical protein F6K65_43540 [Moorea sp. SIO3C2]|nr:hypothetical protein [Moorena sp. SIO3C2]